MRVVGKRSVGAIILLLCPLLLSTAAAQSDVAVPAHAPDSVAGHGPNPVLERVLTAWPAGRVDTVAQPGEWSYEEGVLLDGMIALWRVTGDTRLFDYAHAAVDRSVNANGIIHFDGDAPYPADAHALDNIEMGRATLSLYRVLQQDRYYKAARFLHDQLEKQPKNAAGGFWHKSIYPDQMWLDGAYMAGPFLEGYGRTFAYQDDMDTAANQLLLMYSKMRTRPSNLLRHGWDSSRQMSWAARDTGLSPEVWSRAMGWYAMAMVDVLERMLPADPQRAAFEDVTRQVLTTIARYQDAESGLWWQVMDKPPARGTSNGNYLEASASCMFVYALAKGIRLGVAPLTLEANVTKGWEGIQKRFVKADGTFSGTVKVGGLGGTPFRSGTFAYYVAEPVVDNDPKGVGAYLLALSEVIQRHRAGDLLRKARGKTVLLDAWFNADLRKTADGNTELFHYKWTDEANSGYANWGRMFQQYGMRVEMLDHAPRAADLRGVDLYIIASPDPGASVTAVNQPQALNPSPHFMDKDSAAAIEAWVKTGGTLVLMENDSEHADQTHLDLLSDSFGLHFNPVTRNRMLPEATGTPSYANTIVPIPAGTGGIFLQAHRALMKETCTLTVSSPAKALLSERTDAPEDEKSDVFMAVAQAGKGIVYANVDPWLYNEYTDGRKLPLGEDNFAAGLELTRWLVSQAVQR